MAKIPYIGDSNITKKVNGLYIGNQNISSKILKGYIGVDNQAKLWFDNSFNVKPEVDITSIFNTYSDYTITSDIGRFILWKTDGYLYNTKLQIIVVPYDTIEDSSTYQSYTYNIGRSPVWDEYLSGGIMHVSDIWMHMVGSDGTDNFFITCTAGTESDGPNATTYKVAMSFCVKNFTTITTKFRVYNYYSFVDEDTFSPISSYYSENLGVWYTVFLKENGSYKFDRSLCIQTPTTTNYVKDINTVTDNNGGVLPAFMDIDQTYTGLFLPITINPTLYNRLYKATTSTVSDAITPGMNLTISNNKPVIIFGRYFVRVGYNFKSDVVTLFKYNGKSSSAITQIKVFTKDNNLLSIVPFNNTDGTWSLYFVYTTDSNIRIDIIDPENGNVKDSFINSKYNKSTLKGICALAKQQLITRYSYTYGMNIGSNHYDNSGPVTGDGSIIVYKTDQTTSKNKYYFDNILNYLK